MTTNTIESYAVQGKGILYCFNDYIDGFGVTLFSNGHWYQVLDDSNLTYYEILDNTGNKYAFNKVYPNVSDYFGTWFTDGTFNMTYANGVYDNTRCWRGDFRSEQDAMIKSVHLVYYTPRPYDYVEITYTTPIGDIAMQSGQLFRLMANFVPSAY